MTGRERAGRPRRSIGPRAWWRPDWTWRFRQATGLVFFIAFIAEIPLAVIAGIGFGKTAVAWVFAGWFVMVVLLGTVLGVIGQRLRREWSAVVARHGWSVSAERPELAERWPFPPFDDKLGVKVLQVTEGTHRGRRFWTGLFEYADLRTRPAFAFIDLEIDRPLPAMWVTPESLVGELAPGLLPLDLHLENHEFNNRYRLFRGDRAVVHAVLNPRAMEVLLSVQPFGWVSEGRRFVVVTPGYRRAKTVLAQLDAACDLLELIPEHVWRPIGNQPQR